MLKNETGKKNINLKKKIKIQKITIKALNLIRKKTKG
jgi:hypothetical protein